MLRDLHVWRWVDKLTRAVTIELTTMSTNVNVIVNTVILGSFYVHLGFRISAYVAVGNNPALQPDVVGHPEVFMPFGQLMEPLVLGNNLLALLSITCWVKLFKYLCMSSYFRLLVRILESCAARISLSP